jgi:hypothetical protein
MCHQPLEIIRTGGAARRRLRIEHIGKRGQVRLVTDEPRLQPRQPRIVALRFLPLVRDAAAASAARDVDLLVDRRQTGQIRKSRSNWHFRAKERGFALLSASDLRGLQNADSHPLCFSWRLPIFTSKFEPPNANEVMIQVFNAPYLYCPRICLKSQFVLRQAPTAVLLMRGALANKTCVV